MQPQKLSEEEIRSKLREVYEDFNNPLNMLGAKQEIMTNFFRDTLPELLKEVRE